jgi:hypothetical protein
MKKPLSMKGAFEAFLGQIEETGRLSPMSEAMLAMIYI